ncbi:MAG TPA: hypothetical protein PLQ93_04885 [Bacteroidia bacterium]|nr:hypothetical protein [Bacteroidia bacterium]
MPFSPKISLSLLFVFLLCLGLNALAGGLLLIIHPNGDLLGMEMNPSMSSLFPSYFLPGLILFCFLGLLPLFSLYGLISQRKILWAEHLNLHTNMHWSWTFSVYSGFVALIWIMVQQILIGYFWLQSLILFLACGIIMLCFLPVLMRRYKRKISE